MAQIKILAIGGGGAGGSSPAFGVGGGGGGAGGYQYNAAYSITPGSYAVTIGGGGQTAGANGDDTTFDTITAIGGGGGGSGNQPGTSGSNGGSGGGGGGNRANPAQINTGGTGSQGHNGGNGTAGVHNSQDGNAGGGGGSGTAGSNAPGKDGPGGVGGNGTSNSITGSAVTYAGGGGGGGSDSAASGGTGGGGAGGYYTGTNGIAGTDGLGGGGGGSGGSTSTFGKGGKGVVIISYVTADFGACTGGTITTDGANTVHTFTSSGTFVLSLPFSIDTLVATDVGQHTATGNGEIDSDGGHTITQRGFCWSLTPNPTTSDDKVIVAGTTGAYSGAITALSPGLTYHYRAYAINSDGTHYGDDVTFDTVPAVSLITEDATNITKTTATGNGNVLDDGGETITERGFTWGTSPHPIISGDKVIVAGTTGEYDGSMTGLTQGTLYYYRAYTISDSGVSYGEDIVFTTIGLYSRIGAMDQTFTDFDEPIYFEYIDRWRAYTDMYAKTKSISGMNMYTENAAGVRVYFQAQKSPPNVWEDIGTITEQNNSLFPNAQTKDFTVGRIRMAGFTSGTPIVFHSIEILSINDKGFDQN